MFFTVIVISCLEVEIWYLSAIHVGRSDGGLAIDWQKKLISTSQKNF